MISWFVYINIISKSFFTFCATQIATVLRPLIIIVEYHVMWIVCEFVKIHFCLLILTSVSAREPKVYFRNYLALLLSASIQFFLFGAQLSQRPLVYPMKVFCPLNEPWNLLSANAEKKEGRNQFCVKCNSKMRRKKVIYTYRLYISVNITNQTNKFANKFAYAKHLTFIN